MKIIFLHGLGQTAQSWDSVIECLPTNYSSSAIHLFHHVTDDEILSLDSLDSFLSKKLAFVDEPFILCGLSLGAILALKQAITPHPFLKGVILSAPQFESLNKALLFFHNTIFRFLPKKSFTQLGLAKKQALQLMGSLSSLHSINQVANLNLPTLIICGEKDKTNLPAAKELASLIPNSQLYLITNGKHELNTEQSFLFAKVVEVFLVEF